MTHTIRYYNWVPEWLGDPTTASEREAADDRAQTYIDDHEGDDLCIIVRRPRPGEAAGVYERADNGTLQILGYSVEVPEDVRELLDRAHQHALATWPATPPADPATVRAVASAMVAADRRSRDCEPEVRDDPDAGDGSGWEHGAVGDLARDLALSIEDGAAWAEAHREAILDAYAVAWREAVEADLATRRFAVGERVTTVGLTDEDSDSGHVVRYLDDDVVLVAWDGGVVTPCPVEYLVEE